MKTCCNRLFTLAFILVLVVPFAQGQDIASFEKKITVKKLPNGLTALIMERPEAPVFSFYTHVDVGSAQEVQGITGLAHMFEHMAFKGTDKIGTTNFPAEKAALAKVEQAYAAYQQENMKEVGRDPQKVAELEKKWREAIDAADAYVAVNEFSNIVESQCFVNEKATTDWDETVYF